MDVSICEDGYQMDMEVIATHERIMTSNSIDSSLLHNKNVFCPNVNRFDLGNINIKPKESNAGCAKINPQLICSNILNLVAYSNAALPNDSLASVPTAVQQPNIGANTCFICGFSLTDFNERFNYLQSQKLFYMQVSLLQLLSDVLKQKVLTNTESVDLCKSCSELINETDNTYKQFMDLTQRITDLFSSNKRPKLTYHALPNVSSIQNCSDSTSAAKNEISLADLALTRPRRGRRPKNECQVKIGQPNDGESKIKRKGGRPRKPYQCTFCRRKFLTQSMVECHTSKEHKNSAAKYANPEDNISNNILSEKNLNAPIESTNCVKKESAQEVKSASSDSISADIESSSEKSAKYEPDYNLESHQSKIVITDQKNMRPIQPKPETLMQTGIDGSLIFLMNPTTPDSSPAIIKVSRNYVDLQNESFICQDCNASFFYEKSYNIHCATIHGPQRNKRARDGSKEASKTREQKNESGIIFSCRKCKIICSTKKLLIEHKRDMHAQNTGMRKALQKKKYTCEHCEKVFIFKYEVESHKDSHLPFNQVGPHEFVCNVCGLKVASKAALKIHFHRFHNNEVETKEFLCAKCGYMTSTRKAFSDHLRVHREYPEPKMRCHICRKEMLPTSYKIHMLRMHGEARYPCQTCGQRFSLRSDLMKHLNTIHSTLRPYDCSICNLKFVTSEALRYHKNKIHSSVYYFCEVCGKCCKWKGELRAHKIRCHSNSKTKYQCSFCSVLYANKRKLRRHMINKHNISKEDAFSKNNQLVTSVSESAIAYKEMKEVVFKMPANDIESTSTLTSEAVNSIEDTQIATTQHPIIEGQHQSHELTNIVYQQSHIPLSLSSMALHLEQELHTAHLQPAQDDISPSHILNPDQHPTHHGPSSHELHSNPLDDQTNALDAVHAIYLVPEMNMSMTIQDEQLSTS